MATFSSEQLNFFKFSAVVIDEFPVALRRTFADMWDKDVAPKPGSQTWDDSSSVRNMFLTNEGGKTKYVPTSKSYMEWDCTALFEATLFAKSFAMPDGKGGLATLHKLFVKPRALLSSGFHSSVLSLVGKQEETFALALDQLRLLRNTLCHQISTQKIDKASFDHYIQLAKDAFAALGQSSTKIDDIGKLGETNFPTARVQQLEGELRRENFKRMEENQDQIVSQVKTGVTDVKTKVEDVGSDVKTKVEDVGSDVKTKVEDVGSYVKTKVEAVGSDVKSKVEAVGSDVKTKVEAIGSDVKTKVENVASGVTTRVEGMEKKVEEVGLCMKEVKAEFDEIKQAVQAGNSKGSFVPDSCMPDNISHFVGRQKECQAILHHLTDENTRLVNVWGPPGFGKTSVAIHVAHYLHEDMKIPVYFASLRGMESKEDLVSKLLSMFTEAKQGPHISSSHWLIQCLQLQKNPLVLILDNADDLLQSHDAKRKQQVLRFIEEILAQCKHIKLLLTSRESLNFLSLTLQIHLEKITVLDQVSSASLVQSLLPDVSEDDRSFVVRECDQVPLALRLMCSMVKEDYISIDELQEELKSSPLVEVLDNESFPDDARLKTIIKTSFCGLPARERKAFVSLAVFPGGFTIQEATAVLDVETELQTKKIIRSLERKSLVDCEDNYYLSYFTIHSLFRSYVDEERGIDKSLEEVFLTAQLRFYDYYISRFEHANETFLIGTSSEAAVIFVDGRQNILLSLVNGVRNDKLYRKAVGVLCKAELFLFAVLPDEELLFEQLYDIAIQETKRRQNVFNEKRLLASKCFRHWGWFSSGQQTWDDSLYAGCTNEADCPAKLLCYHGVHQLLCGRLDEGKSTLLNSLDHLSNCGDEIVLKVLVICVLEAKGEDEGRLRQKDKATYEWFETRLSRFTSHEGGRNYYPFFDAGKMGDFFFFALFVRLLQNFLDLEIQQISAVFSSIATAFSRNMALHGEGLKQSLIAMNRLLKDSKANQLLGKYFKASLSDKEADLFEGLILKPLLEWTDQILEKEFSSSQSYNSATYMMETFSRYIDASLPWPFAPNFSKDIFDTIENVLKSNENVPERDLEELARSYDRLGMLRRFLISDYHGAIRSYQQGMIVREKHIGDHVDTVSSLTKIGCLYSKMQNEIEAEKSFQNALELRKRLDVYDDVDPASIYSTFGENHCKLGNYDKALEAHLQALTLRQKHFGAHPLTAQSTFEVGCVYLAMESYQEALEFCQRALDMRLELLGEHKDTAKIFNLLGNIHFKMGDNISAVENLEAAVYMRLNVLGDHEDTASSYCDLGLVQLAMGNLSGALESFCKALAIMRPAF